jgi:acetyl esterase/lipase
MMEARVVLALPGMGGVEVRTDLIYRRDPELRFDLYRPPGTPPGAAWPAVIFAHGDAPPEILAGAKDWGVFTSWGRLAAVSGLAAVTFDRRSSQMRTRLADSAADSAALIAHVRSNAGELGIEPDRLAVWVCSAGPPMVLPALLHEGPAFLRCVVSYYGLMDLLHLRDHIAPEVSDAELREHSPLCALQEAGSALPPMLIARAGLDEPRFNDSIDAFITEAIARGVELDVLTHPRGRHAFDVLDDDDRSRDIIARTLEFLARHLNAPRR